MKKRFFGILLLGAMIVASMSMFTSCKDYDDDINELRALIDKNAKAIDQINTLITQGSVITNVEDIAGGVSIKLSNGKTYEITNGTNGVDGKNGTVWTINEDGYWVKDGVATNYKAIGQDGTNGINGKDGAEWTISADGYWVKDGVKTDIKAIGVDGKDGKDGVDGKDGANGKDGVDGRDGVDGKDGKDGIDGKDGKDGIDGKRH